MFIIQIIRRAEDCHLSWCPLPMSPLKTAGPRGRLGHDRCVCLPAKGLAVSGPPILLPLSCTGRESCLLSISLPAVKPAGVVCFLRSCVPVSPGYVNRSLGRARGSRGEEQESLAPPRSCWHGSRPPGELIARGECHSNRDAGGRWRTWAVCTPPWHRTPVKWEATAFSLVHVFIV